jgi:beta-galactosidase beta subunit
MRLLLRRVKQGDTIRFGEVHEKTVEKNGQNLDLRMIHSGEESEYVVVREDVEKQNPEFDAPERSQFLGMNRNSHKVNLTHLYFAVPIEQYGGSE